MTSACVKWGHALGFSGSLGEFDKLSLNFEVKVTSPRSKLPRGALSDWHRTNEYVHSPSTLEIARLAAAKRANVLFPYVGRHSHLSATVTS